MLVAEGTDKEVKDYVKERFRSAMQLMRNIAQRKSTILRTCEVIVRRQQDFLDQGVEALRPRIHAQAREARLGLPADRVVPWPISMRLPRKG